MPVYRDEAPGEHMMRSIPSLRGRAGGVLVMVLALALMLAGCSTGDGDDSSMPASAPPELATVPPSQIEGLDTIVEEDFGPGRVTFASLPIVPGAESFTDEIQIVVDADIERFTADTEPGDIEPVPELQVTWDLVAASPEVLGARIRTRELFATGDDGRVATAWYDVAADAGYLAAALIADGATQELSSRLRAVAVSDPRIDDALLDRALAEDADVFDALAFTPEGDLYVEFDQGLVADEELGPVALAVDSAGLLSPLGESAQAAATDPSDPSLASATPTAPPAPSPTGPPPDTDGVDCGQAQCVALTFDDGPVQGTADLLDVLAEKGAKATFFVVGSNAAAQPDLLARMVEEGHVVGNHTEDHPDLTKLDSSAVRSEIEQVNDTVEAATGVRPALLRPPYGASNDTVDGVTAELGMSQILWNVDPEDWKDRDSAIVEQRVVANTAAGDIVLSHDIHETTRAAYADIIDQLQAEGFVLVTVPTLLGSLEPGQRYYSR